MSFAYPQLLYCLLGLGPLLICFFMSQKRYESRLNRLMRREFQSLLLPRWSGQKPLLSWILQLLALIALILALARPRFDYEWRDVTQRGADVMIALDVSRSMNAADINPSRLIRAKREILDFLQVVRGDRVGLILFAGVGFIQCPLTQDIKALEMFLEQVDSDSIPTQGTSIGQAIRLGIQALKSGAEVESAGKAMILISDGEDQDTDPLLAAKEAADQGVFVHTIAVGGQGAPIPVADGGFLQDDSGHLVVSKPNESMLREIAQLTGANYIHSDSGDFGLDQLYRTKIRPALKETEQTQKQRVWNEQHYLLSALASILFAIDLGLNFWRLRRPKLLQSEIMSKNAARLKGLAVRL